MGVFVTVAVALAVFSAAVLVVGARALLRSLKGLRRAVERTAEQLQPLADELEAESAVAAVEIEQLQRRMERARER